MNIHTSSQLISIIFFVFFTILPQLQNDTLNRLLTMLKMIKKDFLLIYDSINHDGQKT